MLKKEKKSVPISREFMFLLSKALLWRKKKEFT